MARRTALVTGASLGIGAAFARRLAADGYDLVLVARDGTRLEDVAKELTATHGVSVEVLPANLATGPGRALVAQRLADSERVVDLLINNAGTSLNTPFVRSALEQEHELIELNVKAVLELSHAALRGMVQRRDGAIINVSSVAGFGIPMAGSTYSASKAWVTNFSESVGLSVAPFGVRVMALCPGYVRTGYHERAGIDMSKTPDWMWLDTDTVVAAALRDLGRGKRVSIPTLRYKALAGALRHLPRSLVSRAARDTRGRIGRS
ncbi:MAG TPA: SDR family oxidoreductase [Micromonosporaceae bacterium]|nr:SDR family oxidoreductase [Micromonosporaceae bacterium]